MSLKLLLTKSFWIMLVAVLVQQLIVASSSFWLASFVTQLKDGQFIWLLLICYLMSLVLPYLPGAVAHHFQTMWSFEVVLRFYNQTLDAFKGRIGAWNHEETRGKKEALLIKDGPEYISDMTSYVYDVLSVSLNAVLNILVIVWLLDLEFLVSYGVGLILTVVVLRLQRNGHEARALSVEKNKNQVTQLLSSAWDHWVINNTSFLNSWQKDFSARHGRYKDSLNQLSWKKEMSAVILSLSSFLPTLFAACIFAYKNMGQTSELLNLIVLLPRLFMILGHTTSLIYLVRDFSIMKSRGEFISQVLNQPWDFNWEGRIQKNKINITNQNCKGVDFDQNVLTEVKGYWTVRGSNGAGKSSWLMRLKEDLGERACYLPPKSHLGSVEIATGLSTGQKIKEQIRLALKHSNISVLLLDEWDANLDESNRQEVLETLKTLGQRLCVIDIRHR